MAFLPESLLDPVSEDRPTGPFLQYEPGETVYDEVREARREEADLPQGDWARERKVADFRSVALLCTKALARSKDLQLAVWLTEALLAQHGPVGMAEGLEFVAELLSRYWSGLHPPIDEDGDVEFRLMPLRAMDRELSGRLATAGITAAGLSLIDLGVSKSVPTKEEAEGDPHKRAAREEARALEKTAPEAWEEAVRATNKAWLKELLTALDASASALTRLDALIRDQVDDDPPRYTELTGTLGRVRDAVRKLLAEKLQADPDPLDASVGELSYLVGDGGGPPAHDGAATPDSAAIAPPQTVQDAARLLDTAARFMRGQDPTDPTPYVLLRSFRWSELREDRGHVDPRLLAAPPTQMRSRLKGLLLDQRWDELLEEGERVMATPFGRGWLDLQRYIAAACVGLGPRYDAVAGGIRRCVRDLLRRVPDIVEMSLMDDTSTANGETRRWLSDEGLLGDGDDDEAAGSLAAGSFSGRSLQPVILAGDPDRAVARLLGRAEREPSSRGRFLLQSHAAAVMVDRGNFGVAAQVLRGLKAQVEEHKLEDWEEGEVVALPLSLLFKCYSALDVEFDARQDIYDAICRLDPVGALQLAKASGRSSNGDVEEGHGTPEE